MTVPPGDSVGDIGRNRTDLLEALKRGQITGRDERLRAATALFEGVLTAELFKSMRSTVPEGGAVSGGSGEEIFAGLLDQHLADAAAARSQGGIGEALYRHFGGAAPEAVTGDLSEPLKQTKQPVEEGGNGGRVFSALGTSEFVALTVTEEPEGAPDSAHRPLLPDRSPG